MVTVELCPAVTTGLALLKFNVVELPPFTVTKILPHWLVETVEHTVSVVLPVVCPVIIIESPLAKALATEELELLVTETLPLDGEATTVALFGLFKETLVWLKVRVPEIQPPVQLPGGIWTVGDCAPPIITYNSTALELPSKLIVWVKFVALPFASVVPILLPLVVNVDALCRWYK